MTALILLASSKTGSGPAAKGPGAEEGQTQGSPRRGRKQPWVAEYPLLRVVVVGVTNVKVLWD